MSEKRFELRNYGNEDEIQEIIDKQGESLFTWEDIEKKLNQLNDKNKWLKLELECSENAIRLKEVINDINHLTKENYDLKQRLKILQEVLDATRVMSEMMSENLRGYSND